MPKEKKQKQFNNEETVQNSEGRFVVTFPLKVREDQDHVLQKRFRISEVIRDRLFNRMKERLESLQNTETWENNQKGIASVLQEIREKEKLIQGYEKEENESADKQKKKILKEEIKELKTQVRLKKAELKPYYDRRNQWMKENNFTKFGFFTEVKDIYKPFNKNIDSMTAISIAELCLIGLSIYYRNIYITLWFGLFMVLYSIDFTRSWKQYLEAKKMLEKTIDDIAEHRKEVKEKEGSQKNEF